MNSQAKPTGPPRVKNALVAFDKFKDAITAHEACQAAAETLGEIHPEWTVSTSPLADGGDGFCDTLTRICEGSFNECRVTGPLGEETTARYGMVETRKISSPAAARLTLPPETKTLAIIEFAQSSGIALVPSEQRSPWTTTSYGLGQTIKHACEHGADAVLVGLGGSATHDLALGALQVLGFRFLDADQVELEDKPVPELWQSIRNIAAPINSFGIPVRLACDVENPLLGPNGAAAVFGPQKGLLPIDYQSIESETHRLAILLSHSTKTGVQLVNTPGAGAAGGAAFGLMAGLEGILIEGSELVFDWSSLHEKLAAADLVITGEGRFDASSLQGKGPGALAKLCLKKSKQLLILAGSLGDLPDPNIASRARAISPSGMPLAEAIEKTGANLRTAIRSET